MLSGKKIQGVYQFATRLNTTGMHALYEIAATQHDPEHACDSYSAAYKPLHRDHKFTDDMLTITLCMSASGNAECRNSNVYNPQINPNCEIDIKCY